MKRFQITEAEYEAIKAKRCWCPKGQRPSVPCHHIREYRYVFGAVEPLSGESFFLTMPNCDTECTNIFLEKLSEQYLDDMILLVCDGASWHKSKALLVVNGYSNVFRLRVVINPSRYHPSFQAASRTNISTDDYLLKYSSIPLLYLS